MKCNLIGAGRLGKNIAISLFSAQIIHELSICNQSELSAKNACHVLGTGRPIAHLDTLPQGDVTWLACNDDSLRPLIQELREKKLIKPGNFVIHCSGVLNSSILNPLKDQGCAIASFHPLKSFRSGYLDAKAFDGVYCAIEGDEVVCSWLTESFSHLGASLVSLSSQSKASYHAGACMASNYFITLAACSKALFCDSGISDEQAQGMVGHLMQGAIDNWLATKNSGDALTGPLMRGDVETLALHLQAVEDPLIHALYKTAGLATLPLTQLVAEKKGLIERLLLDL